MFYYQVTRLLYMLAVISVLLMMIITSVILRSHPYPSHARSGHGTSAARAERSLVTRKNCTRNFDKAHYLDIMKMPRLPFLRNLKNPCWLDKGTLNCLPYVYLAGFAKCGTTDLFKRLTLHPHFIPPTIKEPNWLSSGRFYRSNSTITDYARFFKPLADTLSPKLSKTSVPFITGEGSVNTVMGSHKWQYIEPNTGLTEPLHNNPQFIHHLFPQTRILINVRDPVKRLWSEYLAFSQAPLKSAKRFHQIVSQEIRMYRDCLAKTSLRSCAYDRTLAMSASKDVKELRVDKCYQKNPTDIIMLRRGIYHVFIKDYIDTFSRAHVLVQRMEDISSNLSGAMYNTFTFLGLRPMNTKEWKKVLRLSVRNSRTKNDKSVGEMWPETRKLLKEFYAPFNHELAKLLNDSRFEYH